MKRIILSMMLAFATTAMYSQSWFPLGNGVYPAKSINFSTTSTTYNGNLYVMEANPISGGYSLVANIWDGSSWSQTPAFTPGLSFSIRAAVGFQGKIYVLLNDSLAVFNGSTWSFANMPSGNWLNDLEVVNGNLVVGGDFSPGQPGDHVAAVYDGSTWTVLPGLNVSSTLYTATQIIDHGGDLYVLTYRDSINAITTNLFKFDGTSWSYAANNFYNSSITNIEFNRVMSDGQKFYGFDYNNVYRIENDSINLVSPIGLPIGIGDHVYYNGKFYMSGYFGASSSSRTTMAVFDGQNITQLLNTPAYGGWPQAISSLATGNGLLYASGNFTQFGGVTYNSVMAGMGNFASISGKLFHDQNSDCNLSSGESGIGAAIIEMNPGNVQIATNAWGNYSIGVSPGTYTLGNINYTQSVHQNIATSSCNGTVSVTLTSNQSVQQDIAAELNTSDPDLVAELTSYTSWRARFGFDVLYKLEALNVGASNESNVTLSLNVPSGLQISSADPNYTSQSGNTYTWNIASLPSLSDFSSLITINMDTAVVNMGDSIQFNTTVSTASGEVNIGNNTSDLIQEIVAAYDPNDKTVFSKEVAPGTDRLEYMIRFQNTGNDTAFRVVVRDTLESSLYASQLEMISASHPYQLNIDGDLLTWEFNNILLPDSSVDLAGSQGYIRFSLGIDPTLGVGEVVENDAQIYFDYQQPVFTNTAQTTIVQPVGLTELNQKRLMEIYPNPANDMIFVESGATQKQTLRLFDSSGKVLNEQVINPKERISINVGGLAPGLYLLKSENETSRVIITR